VEVDDVIDVKQERQRAINNHNNDPASDALQLKGLTKVS
jgi:hypothetical protein